MEPCDRCDRLGKRCNYPPKSARSKPKLSESKESVSKRKGKEKIQSKEFEGQTVIVTKKAEFSEQKQVAPLPLEERRCKKCRREFLVEDAYCLFCGEMVHSNSHQETLVLANQEREVDVANSFEKKTLEKILKAGEQPNQKLLECRIPSLLLPSAAKKAGTMYFFGYYPFSLEGPQDFHALNLVINSLSPQMASYVGIEPHEAKGASAGVFSPSKQIPLQVFKNFASKYFATVRAQQENPVYIKTCVLLKTPSGGISFNQFCSAVFLDHTRKPIGKTLNPFHFSLETLTFSLFINL